MPDRHLATALVAPLLVFLGLGLPAAAQEDDWGYQPEAYVIVQGKLKPGVQEIYRKYIAGARPLLVEYGAEVTAVGSGIDDEHAGEAWQINSVMRFRDLETARKFLADPRFVELTKRYRDRAYEVYNLTLVQGRPPLVRPAKSIAEEAFEDFEHGLATGEWVDFLDRLSDDVAWSFPAAPFRGEHKGKASIAKLFAHVAKLFPGGLEVEVERVTAEDGRVVFEFKDSGKKDGKPYANRIALALDVCGEQICGYREYFGLVGEP